MVKVFSVCLWGNNPIYTVGAIKNAILCAEFYPDFEYWVYVHTPSVPEDVIQTLRDMKHVKVILRTGDVTTCKPMMWRFEPIDDPTVDVMLSRDVDTRILSREKLAVDEWLQSGKAFHMMRDHPYHYDPNAKIMGGMFGTKKLGISWIHEMNKVVQVSERQYDQYFLNDVIYPIVYNNTLVHTSFTIYTFEADSRRFPIQYGDDFRFVGEYVYADDSRPQSYIDALSACIPAGH